MSNLWKSIQIAGIIGGVCVSACQLMPAVASDVIRDKEWVIKIRPGGRSGRNSSVTEESPRRVLPAAYDEPAPAPEVVPVAVPAPEPAQDLETPDGPKRNGPQLAPTVAPAPATYSDPATRSVDLVPGILPRTMSYDEAYAAVPFSRTEYEANPTYRHQAALELMFHTLRPVTTVQNFSPRAFRYPDSYQIPYSSSDTQHIDVRNFGGGPNYNGQSPFGYPYGLKGNW
jgi:hypothetical protein